MGKPDFPIPPREGYTLPNPPRGRGLGARASGPRPLRYGETRFPHPPRRGLIFTSGHTDPAKDERSTYVDPSA